MSEKNEDKKIFKKIEGGMIYLDENGEVMFIGLPKKVKEVTGGKVGFWAKMFEGGGAEVAGKKESEIDYHWVRVGNRLPPLTQERQEFENVANLSGTIAVTSASTVVSVSLFSKLCPRCGTYNIDLATHCKQCNYNFDIE